jgi:hypothetical protein
MPHFRLHPTITADYYAIMTNGIGLYDLAESRLSTENEMLAVVFGVASNEGRLWTHNKMEKLAKVDKKSLLNGNSNRQKWQVWDNYGVSLFTVLSFSPQTTR